jgi:hypothetical protein
MCLVLTQRVVTIAGAATPFRSMRGRARVLHAERHTGFSMAAAARPFVVGIAMLIAAGFGLVMGALPWQGRARDDDLG